MMNFSENDGYSFDGKPKKKKRTDYPAEDIWQDDAPQQAATAGMLGSMQELGARMDSEQKRWSVPVKENSYIDSAKDFLVPKDTELRRRRQFVLNENIVNEAVDNLYADNVQGVFKKERAAAEDAANREYMRYASVPGADPLTSLGAMRAKADPKKVVDNTMKSIDRDKLDDIASAYAGYARLSPDAYRDSVLEPQLRQRMASVYVDEATPKSSMEYIARSAYDNSLTGKLVNLGIDGRSQSSSQTDINREGLIAYNANRAENLAGGIGSLLVDIPMFAGLGALSSKAVTAAGNKILGSMAGNLVKKYAARGMQLPQAQRIVERAVVGKIGSKILASSGTQGLVLGNYNAANSLADDLLYNDGIDVNKVANAFAHGLGTGTMLGAVGTPLREAARGLTGGTKMAASAGILGAESAVFTLGSTIDKAMAGVDVEPVDLLYDFGESAATLGAMRLAHWRPKGAFAKLNASGKLKEMFRLSPSEKRELILAGISPNTFIADLEKAFNTPAKENAEQLNGIKERYLKLMSSDELSAATRSKLLYLVENKVTSTPPLAVDYTVNKLPSGGYELTLLDANGMRITSKSVEGKKDVETFLIVNRGELRKNKIAKYEEALLGKYDTENFFRQAGNYSKETGVSVDAISEAMYKKASDKPLTADENRILEEISQRTTYGDKGVGQMLYDIRRQLETDYNLHEGSLLAAINRKAYRCSTAENRALDRYLEIIRDEASGLEQGTSPQRAGELNARRAVSPYGKYGNDDVKQKESGNYFDYVAGSDAAGPDSRTSPVIEVPQNWDQPYAWSYNGVRNSMKDMKRMERRAARLAANLGYKLNYIYDERSIPADVEPAEYNSMVRSLGWLDNRTGKVYINLPNIRSMNELERTVVHEVVGHGGLSNLFGEYLFDFYEDVYKQADPAMRNEIHNMKSRYGTNSGFTAIEEYLAHLAEKDAPTPNERKLLSNFRDFVENSLERMDILTDSKGNVSEEEIAALMSAHHNAMLNRTAPDDYRASVFSVYPSARHKVDYYDREAYDRMMSDRIMNEDIMDGTPDFLWSDKMKLYGDKLRGKTAARNGSSYKFIGEKGAENLSYLGEDDNAYAFRHLREAKSMERAGRSSSDIWRETGWARGADGKWRGEINENSMEIADIIGDLLYGSDSELAHEYKRLQRLKGVIPENDMQRSLKKILKHSGYLFDNIKVRDLVKDDLLYSAYPEIGALPLKFTDRMHGVSYYNPKEKTLYVNITALTNPAMLKRRLTKPLQEMIQHYEGFSMGVDFYKADVENRFRGEYIKALSDAENIVNIRKSGRYNNISSALDKMYETLHGITPDEFIKKYPGFNEYILHRLYGDGLSFSGDVESRNALERYHMNAVERHENMPSATEDFPRSKQLVIKKYSALKDMLKGPMEIIYNKLKENSFTSPMRIGKKVHDYAYGFTPLEQNLMEESRIMEHLEEHYAEKRRAERERRLIENAYDDETAKPVEKTPAGRVYYYIDKKPKRNDYGWSEYKAKLDRLDKERRELIERLEREEWELEREDDGLKRNLFRWYKPPRKDN